MLEMYVSSIIIWMIIFHCITKILSDSIKGNGWKSEQPTNKGKFSTLVTVSAVPLLRVILLLVIFMMSLKKKDDFEHWKNTKK